MCEVSHNIRAGPATSGPYMYKRSLVVAEEHSSLRLDEDRTVCSVLNLHLAHRNVCGKAGDYRKNGGPTGKAYIVDRTV